MRSADGSRGGGGGGGIVCVKTSRLSTEDLLHVDGQLELARVQAVAAGDGVIADSAKMTNKMTIIN